MMLMGMNMHTLTTEIRIYDSLPFDWENNYKFSNIPEKDLVVYEMNVRAFTADESSGLEPDIRGSYLGVIEKMGALQDSETNSPSLRTLPGQHFPLGVSEVDNGINFAIFSQHATAVTLCLSLPQREAHGIEDGEMVELALDPHQNRTGDVWHICVKVFSLTFF
ncbi:hypothetical protein CsatB_019181 [Cannabis sativa]